MQIDILGSCVCRDLFRYMPEELYSVERCMGNIPISTLYEKKFHLKSVESICRDWADIITGC